MDRSNRSARWFGLAVWVSVLVDLFLVVPAVCFPDVFREAFGLSEMPNETFELVEREERGPKVEAQVDGLFQGLTALQYSFLRGSQRSRVAHFERNARQLMVQEIKLRHKGLN